MRRWIGEEAAQLYLDMMAEIGGSMPLQVIMQDFLEIKVGRISCVLPLKNKKLYFGRNEDPAINTTHLIHMGGHLLAGKHEAHDDLLDRFIANAGQMFDQLKRGLIAGVIDLRNLARHLAYLEDHCGIRIGPVHYHGADSLRLPSLLDGQADHDH